MATTSAPGYLAFFTKEVKSVVHNLVKISLTLLKVTSVVLGRKFSLQNVMVYEKKEKLSQRLLKPELWKDVTLNLLI
jgi:hypothetical protein